MKKSMLFLSLCLSTLSLFAQTVLHVTHNKTTNVIFPAAIASVDRGSADIIAQKAGGAENILKVKAVAAGFEETNLSVVTSDGRLYSFTVNYEAKPAGLTVEVEKANGDKGFDALLLSAAGAKENVAVSETAGGFSAALVGVYVKDDAMIFKVRVRNQSPIDYAVGQLRFYVRDRKRGKRTAQQEIEIVPIEKSGNTLKVVSGAEDMWLFIVPKFTTGRDEEMIMQVSEENGSRNLVLKVKTKVLANVRMIN